MAIDIPHPALKGKKALVVGIANDQSIAYGCAAAFRELGADLAITYLNEKARPHVEPLARALDDDGSSKLCRKAMLSLRSKTLRYQCWRDVGIHNVIQQLDIDVSLVGARVPLHAKSVHKVLRNTSTSPGSRVRPSSPAQ